MYRKQANLKERRQARRERAEVRSLYRAGLSEGEQLRRLQDRGHGHCEEAQRLAGE